MAISPESPDDALTTLEKNGLRFEVLSDTGGHLAQALGIHYQLSAGLRDRYQQYGIDLPARNRDESWSLPLPATYVVARGGRIAFAYVQADFFERLDPAVAVQEVARAALRGTTRSDCLRVARGAMAGCRCKRMGGGFARVRAIGT